MWISSGFVHVASVLLFLSGLGTAGVSGYAIYQLNILTNYWSVLLNLAGYCFLVLGAATAIVSAIAFSAVQRKDHKTLRNTSMIALSALMIATLAMVIATNKLDDDFAAEASRIVNGMDLTNLHSVESHLRCCGKWNIQMYNQSSYDLPASCCSVAVSTLCYDGHHYYETGCSMKVQFYADEIILKISLILLLGLLPAMMILQSSALILAKRLTPTTSNYSPLVAGNDV